ncbi:MAG: hypothetical protein PHD72_03505 [Patescibacteria group bacterium]|nr:hypothetical protein [Patescibacteria group bacterium]
MEKAHLIIVGFDDIVSDKYLPCIREAIDCGFISSYSIIDLESQKKEIERRTKIIDVKPESIYYLIHQQKNSWSNVDEFGPLIKKIAENKSRVKVYIATEVKAHEEYLRYCIENKIDSLVEKPIFVPLVNNYFQPKQICSIMSELINEAAANGGNHSVMTLSRYHPIYNDIALSSLRDRMISLKSPLTSFHFRHAGGVWNTHVEYDLREDHPYKYGYGMLMHGAYHYLDLIAQFLRLNKLLFPNDIFSMSIMGYAAYPKDQNDRISKNVSRLFGDDDDIWGLSKRHNKYGETDIVCTYRLRIKRTGRVITLGTISFEQTTPSIRTWKDIPAGIYNKNGRISCVDFEAQLSTLFSESIRCYDVPVVGDRSIDHIDAFARISTRANAALLKTEKYVTEECYRGIFHSDSNRKLMSNWLANSESRSHLGDHMQTMLLLQYIAIAISKQGREVTFDFM